jgi:hypothetical protein
VLTYAGRLRGRAFGPGARGAGRPAVFGAPSVRRAVRAGQIGPRLAQLTGARPGFPRTEWCQTRRHRACNPPLAPLGAGPPPAGTTRCGTTPGWHHSVRDHPRLAPLVQAQLTGGSLLLECVWRECRCPCGAGNPHRVTSDGVRRPLRRCAIRPALPPVERCSARLRSRAEHHVTTSPRQRGISRKRSSCYAPSAQASSVAVTLRVRLGSTGTPGPIVEETVMVRM